ncbi:MAG: phospholipase, partial [bacterium]|nr:phospholipase [bacterium]
LIKQLKNEPDEKIYIMLKKVEQFLYQNNDLLKSEYYGQWDLTYLQSNRVMNLFDNDNLKAVSHLLGFLQRKSEPLQTIKNGIHSDDFNEDVFKPEL